MSSISRLRSPDLLVHGQPGQLLQRVENLALAARPASRDPRRRRYSRPHGCLRHPGRCRRRSRTSPAALRGSPPRSRPSATRRSSRSAVLAGALILRLGLLDGGVGVGQLRGIGFRHVSHSSVSSGLLCHRDAVAGTRRPASPLTFLGSGAGAGFVSRPVRWAGVGDGFPVQRGAQRARRLGAVYDSGPGLLSGSAAISAAVAVPAAFRPFTGLAPGAGALADRRSSTACFLASSSFSILPKT